MKKTIWMAFFAIAATCALAEVPPVLTAEPVAQKWGEEADDEVQRDGLLFWRDDCGALYIGDGETPGGKSVCVGLPEDLYSWTNDVSANGHALLWGGGWSQQAEGGSLLVRLGTNSWLRFVAAEGGTLANLAVSDLDQANGTMRLTADTADPGAVLLVATNLLDPEAWQPATNGEIVASTDASTTWLITLLDTPFEVYRVRTSVTLEAGIHAERTLHANGGIEMGGTTWTTLPDVGTIATNAADAAVAPVAGDLADHAADTDNPHSVTAEQVGAPTVADLNAVSNAINDHIAAAVDPVERRVERLEYPETCRLYWPSSYILSNWDSTTMTIPIPTNFPTRRLCLFVCDDGITNLTIALDTTWSPSEEKIVEVTVARNDGITNRFTKVHGCGVHGGTMPNSSSYRMFKFEWDPISGVSWTMHNFSLAAKQYWYGSARSNVVSGWPDTVTEWEQRYSAVLAGATVNPAVQPLSFSPSQSPSLLAGHLEDLDSLDALAVPSADEPNEFEPAEEAVE